MKYGFMLNLINPLKKEIKFLKNSDFEYIELPMESPYLKKIIKATPNYKFFKVAHVPTFVYTADLSEKIRNASQNLVLESLDIAKRIGIRKLTVHPSYVTGLGRYEKTKVKKMGYDFLGRLYEKANELGLTICLENMMPDEGWLFEPEEFKPILKDFKKMKFMLDIGHANVMGGDDRNLKFIKLFKKRIGHVHVHDNLGFKDDHLPIGCGKINFKKILSNLKKSGYNDTITFELFNEDKDFLSLSLKKVKKIWKAS